MKFPSTTYVEPVEHQPASYLIQGQCAFKIPSSLRQSCVWLAGAQHCCVRAGVVFHSVKGKQLHSKTIALNSHPLSCWVDKNKQHSQQEWSPCVFALFLNHRHHYGRETTMLFSQGACPAINDQKEKVIGIFSFAACCCWQLCPHTDVARRRKWWRC